MDSRGEKILGHFYNQRNFLKFRANSTRFRCAKFLDEIFRFTDNCLDQIRFYSLRRSFLRSSAKFSASLQVISYKNVKLYVSSASAKKLINAAAPDSTEKGRAVLVFPCPASIESRYFV